MRFTTSEARTTRAAALHGAVTVAVCGALLLTGCSGGLNWDGSGDGGSKGPAKPPPTALPSYTSKPVPEGEGSALPDDLNGDGHPELQLVITDEDTDGPALTAFVYGTEHGVDPGTRTVLNANSLGLPMTRVMHDEYAPADALTSPVVPADLDGDGYADLATTRDRTPDDTPGTSASHTEAYVSWGTPKGPRPGRKATRIRLDGHRISPESGLERGDFDGDGKHDLLAYGSESDGSESSESSESNEGSESSEGSDDSGGVPDRFYVLYGPFSRSGEPAKVSEHRGGREEGLYVDEIAPGRATSAVAASCNTGSEDSDELFTAGPEGLGPARTIPPGNLPAFADLDSDEDRELALANDPTCDFYVEEESGPDWEPPRGAATTLKILDGARVTRTLNIPKTAAPLTAARLDDSGTDALLVGHGDPKDTLEDPAAYTTLGVSVLTPGKPPRSLTRGRNTELDSAQDFDGDGRDEVVLKRGRTVYVTDGTNNTARDTVFSLKDLTET